MRAGFAGMLRLRTQITHSCAALVADHHVLCVAGVSLRLTGQADACYPGSVADAAQCAPLAPAPAPVMVMMALRGVSGLWLWPPHRGVRGRRGVARAR